MSKANLYNGSYLQVSSRQRLEFWQCLLRSWQWANFMTEMINLLVNVYIQPRAMCTRFEAWIKNRIVWVLYPGTILMLLQGAFRAALKDYVGRPSPLYHAERLSEHYRQWVSYAVFVLMKCIRLNYSPPWCNILSCKCTIKTSNVLKIHPMIVLELVCRRLNSSQLHGSIGNMSL